MLANRTIAFAASIGALTLVGATGCAAGIFNRLEDGVVRDDAITGVAITGGGGDVTLITDASVKGVDIRRRVQYLRQAPSTGDTISFASGVVTLKTDCGNQCSASYEVRTASTSIKVTGHDGSGDVTLAGVSDVDLEVGSGDISVNGASGKVQVRTGSGDISLTDITGAVAASTGSGDVNGKSLRGATTTLDVSSGDIILDLPGTGNVKAVTSSGDINVRVPDHTCRIVADADSGDQNIETAVEPTSAFLIDLHSGSGDINVTPGLAP